MKKLILSVLSIATFGSAAMAQLAPIPNSGFEDWFESGTFEHPVTPGVPFVSSNTENFYSDSVITVTEVAGVSGSAMRIENVDKDGDTKVGFGSFGIVGDEFGPGIPLAGTDMLTGVTADLRYSINSGTPGLVILAPTTGGTPSGTGNGFLPGVYIFPVFGDQTTFNSSTYTFSPALSTIPDDIVVAFSSGNPITDDATVGDYLEVDNIVLNGTTETVPGGDLDTWEEVEPLEIPYFWQVENYEDTLITKSEDSYEGDFSMRLTNKDDGSGDVDRVARVNLGSYETGGMGEITTLNAGVSLPGAPESFGIRYDRTSVVADSAIIYFTFTKYYSAQDSHAVVGWQELKLGGTTDWDYETLVLGSGMFSDTPDNVIIEINNSYEGSGDEDVDSEMWIDDLKFHFCDDDAEVDGFDLVCTGQTNLDYTVTDDFVSTYSWATTAGTINGSSSDETVNVDITASSNDTMWVTKSYIDACPDVDFYFPLVVSATAAADAGDAQTICENDYAALEGNVGGTTTGIWTTSGSGSFDDDTDLYAYYTPHADDITAGSVTLTLTTTGGTCGTASDDVVISFDLAPTVDAGLDQAICEGTTISLNGIIQNATIALWAGGDGLFAPNNTTLTANYTPHADEVSDGFVDLVLWSTSNGECDAASDTLTIFIQQLAIVDAGGDQTICGDLSAALMAGTSSTGSAVWSTDGSGSFDNSSSLSAIYSPDATDNGNGVVVLTLTSTNNGSCSPVSDVMNLSFDEVPTADASADQTICEGSTADMNGYVQGELGGTWSTSGTGSFDVAFDLEATYTPSIADESAGSVTLTLTGDANGACAATTDEMILTISTAPIVSAGTNQSGCGGFTLAGSVTNASGGIWTSDGTGSFTPDNTDLTGTYTPSSGDVTSGTVTLTLTSTGNGICNAVSDDVMLTVSAAPTADAGTDQNLCVAAGETINLNGAVTTASGGTWTTNGSGSFDDVNSLTATYTIDASDLGIMLNFTLTTTGNGACAAAQDVMDIIYATCSGVDPILANAVSIVPNPTDGIVQVSVEGISGDIAVTVVNPLQQVVSSVVGSSLGTTLNLNGLASGVYIVIIQTDQGTATKRVVKN